MAFDFDPPPALAVGFVDYRTHDLLALVDVDGIAPRTDALEDVEVGGGEGLDGERVQERHRLGKKSVTCMLVGAGAIGFGTLVAGSSAFSSSGAAGGVLLGGTVWLGGGVAVVVGEAMMFTGGIGASRALGKSAAVGRLGIALTGGGIAVMVAGAVADDVTIGAVGVAGTLGGLVCGAVQLGRAGGAGRDAGVISLMIAPTLDGGRMVGVF